MTDEKISKIISRVLRHSPDEVGLTLGSGGWVNIADLVRALKDHGHSASRKLLMEIVEKSDKQRFALSKNGQRIRAAQGHSVDIDLGYKVVEPPELLYHGTVPRSVDDIKKDGLSKRGRHHVHLSPDVETAQCVGARRGKPVTLEIRSGQMHRDGIQFMCSDNGVWLVDSVAPMYIDILWSLTPSGSSE